MIISLAVGGFFLNYMKKQIQMTKDGLEALKVELEELINTKRPRLVERLANARSQGDLNENSDYANAKEELEFLDGRISEIEYVLENATVINGNGGKDGVGVGAKVTVKVNGSEHVFDIVGEWEADPVNKKISPESPLGQALCGKKVGEKVEVEAPAGKVAYEILKIN
jgi:transcription elongation factor GreA